MSLPIERRPTDVKWVYKIKMKPNDNGKIVQYKVRLVAKGFLKGIVWILIKCLLRLQELRQ